MTWPVYRPPGGAGFGGPAKGAGWGGPARGAGHGGPAKGPGRFPGRGDSRRIAARNAACDELRGRLYAIATTAPDEGTQLRAAVALLDRIEGKPLARAVVLGNPDLAATTDAELAALAETLAAQAAEAEQPSG